MKEAMQRWLKKYNMEFNPDVTNALCDRLGLDGEKRDGCYMLVADLEQGRIDDGEFTVGLATLAGKEPEEVAGVLRGVTPVTPEVTERVKFIEMRLAEAKRFKPAKRPSAPPTEAERVALIEEATQEVVDAQTAIKRAITEGADAEDITNLTDELASAKDILKDAKKPFDTVAYEKAIAVAETEDAAIITQVKKLEDELIKLKAAIPKAEAGMLNDVPHTAGLFANSHYGPPETADPEVKQIWRIALKETEAKYPIGHQLLVAEAKRAGVSQEETQKMIAHGIYIERRQALIEKWAKEYGLEKELMEKDKELEKEE